MAKKDQQNRTRIKKGLMLKALLKTKGVVTPALEAADVGRTQFYEWKKEDPEFAQMVNDMDDICLDATETQLHKNIEAGKEASIFFHLKCKGKRRGYIERQEIEQAITVENVGKVTVYLPDNNRDKKSDAEREEFEEGTITPGEAKDEQEAEGES